MYEPQYWDGDTPEAAASSRLGYCRECKRHTVILDFQDGETGAMWTRCQDCLEAEIERHNATEFGKVVRDVGMEWSGVLKPR